MPEIKSIYNIPTPTRITPWDLPGTIDEPKYKDPYGPTPIKYLPAEDVKKLMYDRERQKKTKDRQKARRNR